jgi:hypothetical protein
MLIIQMTETGKEDRVGRRSKQARSFENEKA